MAARPAPIAGYVSASSQIAFAALASGWSFVVHPAGLKVGPKVYTPMFTAMFYGVAKFQAALVMVGASAAAVQAAKSSAGVQRNTWAVAAALYGSILPYTLLRMMQTNHAIMDAGNSGEAAKPELLQAWGPMHAVRTAVSIATTGLSVYALYLLSK